MPLYHISENDNRDKLLLTHIMYTPFVGVLACLLILEERLKEIATKLRVAIKPNRPRRKDDVHRVYIL